MYCINCGNDIGDDLICNDCGYVRQSSMKSNSSNKILKMIFFLLVIFLMLFTNPTLQDHAAKISNIDKNLICSFSGLIPLLGVKYHDYKVFSFVKREKDGTILSFGVLGFVISFTEKE